MTRIGVAALRFNFRGVGRSAGTFDAGLGEKDDFRAALAFARERFPGVPLWAAGMSFGSWIALSVGAGHPEVALLLAISPPVDRYDYDVVKASAKPTFIIHGEEDELVSIKDVRRFYGQLAEPRELCVLEDASHLFEGKTTLVGDAVVDLLEDWKG
jgi:alpha/beta superfamily hydrolase